MKDPILLLGSPYGIHMPQVFVKIYREHIDNKEELEEELIVCSEDYNNVNDIENYWECWDKILNEAIINSKVLVLDEDLWLATEEQAENWEYI